MPTLEVDVGDTSDWEAGLDTGCSSFGAMEYTRCEDLLGEGLLEQAGQAQLATPHRSVLSELVMLESLRIGPFEHAGVVLTRSESSVLGLPFLFNYNVTLDFPRRVAYLERRAVTTKERETCEN
jgi:hypothetical protein